MRRCLLALLLLLVACSKDPVPTTAPSASASTAWPMPSASTASSASAPPNATVAPPPKNPPTALADFLPATLDGTPQMKLPDDPMMRPPKGAAIAAYLDSSKGKSININLMPVQNLKFSKGQFHGLKPGQTKEAAAARLSFKAFDVNGYTVERTQYLTDSKKSEAHILLADKLDVTVSVQPAVDPDESITLIKQLDLAGIEAFLKK